MLVLLRDPIERAWSQIRMDLVRRAGRPLESIAADDVARHLHTKGAARRGDYDRLLEGWGGIAGDRMWVGSYTDITDDPAGLLRSVFAHLDVDPTIDLAGFPLRERLNPGGSVEPPAEVAEVLEDLFGDQDAPRWTGPSDDRAERPMVQT